MSRIFGVASLVLALGSAACSESSPQSLLPTSPTGPIPRPPITSATSIRAYAYDPTWRSIEGVRVEILDGIAAGHSGLTAADGYVTLGGAFDHNTRFRVSKDGYESLTSTWRCSVANCANGSQPWLRFEMRPLRRPLELEGEHTLTITADASCSALPLSSRSRSYSVRLSKRFRDGTADLLGYDGVTHDASVLEPARRFTIGVAGNAINFVFSRGELEVPGLIEEVGANTYVTLNALARGVVSQGTTIAFDFDGVIEHVTTRSPLTGRDSERIEATSRQACSSDGHQLRLVRMSP